MRRIAVILIVLVLISGASVAAEEIKVPFSAVKSSCYDQIDMTKSEFSLSEVGRKCVSEDWLKANLSETEAKVGENKDPKDGTKEVTWDIYLVDDISLGQVKKYDYRIVVNGVVTPEEIKQIGKQVIEEAKRETPFNALVIFFYDYPEYAEGSYTLAKATMAPGGKYEKADTVSTGNYKAMEVTWNDIRKKNWDDQLTPEEVEIWDRWDELLWGKVDMPEDEIAKMVAKEYDVTPERVGEIADKRLVWVYQDLSEERSTEVQTDTQPEEKERVEQPKEEEESLAYQLAIINAETHVRKDHITVKRFSYLLDNIASKTTNTRQEIGDMSVKAMQILEEDYGVKVELIDFMEEANDAIPPGSEMNYAEVAAMIIVLMR